MKYNIKDPKKNIKTLFNSTGIINLLILIFYKWRLTFLQSFLCLQSVNKYLIRLAIQFQLVGAT